MCSKVFGLILLVCFGVRSTRAEHDKLDETFYNNCENTTKNFLNVTEKTVKSMMPVIVDALLPCFECVALDMESVELYKPVEINLSSENTYFQTTSFQISKTRFSCNCSMPLDYEEFSREIDNMTEGASSNKCDDHPEELAEEEKAKNEIESVEKMNVKKCEKHLKLKSEGRISGNIEGYVSDFAFAIDFKALSGDNISKWSDYNIVNPGIVAELQCQGDDDFVNICECCQEAGVFDVVIGDFMKSFIICEDDPLKGYEDQTDKEFSCYQYLKKD